MSRTTGAILVLAVVASCASPKPTQFACDESLACPTGYCCGSAGFCAADGDPTCVVAPDAGGSDGGSETDAGAPDAGAPDAGTDDGGSGDAGRDAGLDAGSGLDAGTCSCSTASGCSGPVDAGGYSTCPTGTICNSGELNDAGVSEGYCVTPQYTVNGDAGTVTDSWTGLLWEQNNPTGTCTWSDATPPAAGSAQAYCQSLSLDGTGWRLPTLPELFSLVDTGKYPTIDSAVFRNSGTVYWSSTLYESGDAWYVAFNFGVTGYSSGVANSNFVRCVR